MEAILSPILQPRYAMGLAMTIVSFAMLAQFVAPVRQHPPGRSEAGGGVGRIGRPRLPHRGAGP